MKKISTKLTGGVVMLIAVILIAIGIPSYQVIVKESNKTLTEQMSKRLDAAWDIVEMLNENEGNDKAKELIRGYIIDRQIGEAGYGFVMDSSGTMIFHPDPNTEGSNVSDEYFAQEMLKNKENFNKTQSEQTEVKLVDYTWEGEKKFAYYTYFEEWDLFIALSGYYKDFATVQKEAMFVLVGVGLLIMIVASIIVFFISRFATKPILALAGAMKEVEKGNLMLDSIKSDSKDEIGVLVNGFNGMLVTLKELTSNIKQSTSVLDQSLKNTKESVEHTVQASDEVTNAIGQIAAGNTALASEIEKGNFSMKEIAESANETNDSAEKMNEVIQKVGTHVQEGSTATRELIEKSAESKKAFITIREKIGLLEQGSEKITSVTEVIRSISEQTNLLSLNAAIESARAGEMGRGFAVVAGEIRNLANQSAEQTDTISSLVTHIQTEIMDIVKTVENSNQTFESQAHAVEQTSKIFGDIEAMMKEMIQNIQIVTSKISHINKNTNSMVDMVESISATSEETTASSEEVNALTEEQYASIQVINDSMNQLYELSMNLTTMVERFKTE